MPTKKTTTPPRKARATEQQMRTGVARVREIAARDKTTVAKACFRAGVNDKTFYRWAAWVAKNPLPAAPPPTRKPERADDGTGPWMPAPRPVTPPTPPDDVYKLRLVVLVPYGHGAVIMSELRKIPGTLIQEATILEPAKPARV